MTVRTAQLVKDNRAYVASVAQDVATCPAGEVWLVREVIISHSGVVGSSDITLRLRSGSDVFRLAQINALANNIPSPLLNRFMVWEAGDAVQLVSTLATNVRIIMFGARLVTTL